jgi:hypothetical protein
MIGYYKLNSYNFTPRTVNFYSRGEDLCFTGNPEDVLALIRSLGPQELCLLGFEKLKGQDGVG